MTGLFKPKTPKVEPVKPIPKREDVATPENELAKRSKRRGVGATLISDQSKLGSSGTLGGE